MLSPASRALVALGLALRAADYRFVTVTPETHRRAIARGPARARTLRDVFGWSRPFDRDEPLPGRMLELLAEAGALEESREGLRSAVRFSSLGAHLFVHSAYPTVDADAVFFGPDTYRFCAAIERAGVAAGRLVDVGCGSGAGGIVGARGGRLVLADVNARALELARVNAELAGRGEVEVVLSDVLAQVEGAIDCVVANPPYLRDEHARTYREGGGAHGEALSVRIVNESLERLAKGGTLLLYTGAPIVEGRDVFRGAIDEALRRSASAFDYRELDPDVFGEELEKPAYAAVDRIAAVVLTATRG